MKKKKINWKAFTKMYHELGQYRIIKHRDIHILQRYCVFSSEWRDMLCYDAEGKYLITDLKSLTDRLLNLRYHNAKDLNKSHKLKKFPREKYKHP